MNRLDVLKQKVEELYTSKRPDADAWIDWGYRNHVLVVAKIAENIAKTQNANVEFCVAGALLHDIADAVMARNRPEHETESLMIADNLLQESGFNIDEADHIIREIIKPHSCDPELPTILEGKVVATADGAAHFMTDFYLLFCWRHYGPQDDYQDFKKWVLRKIEKDYTKKMFFEDIKTEIKPYYEAIKLLYSDQRV